MPVLPELETMLARINEARSQTVAGSVPLAQRREFIHRAMDQRAATLASRAPDHDSSDRTVPVEGGEVAVRIYRPVEAATHCLATCTSTAAAGGSEPWTTVIACAPRVPCTSAA